MIFQYKVNYAFTVKDNTKGKYPMVSDYEQWIQHARGRGFDIQTYFYELDKKDRLHVHGIAIADKRFYKRSLMWKSMHQRIDELPTFLDLQNWSDYIEKDYINSMEYLQMLCAYEIRHLDYGDLYQREDALRSERSESEGERRSQRPKAEATYI